MNVAQAARRGLSYRVFAECEATRGWQVEVACRDAPWTKEMAATHRYRRLNCETRGRNLLVCPKWTRLLDDETQRASRFLSHPDSVGSAAAFDAAETTDAYEA